MPGYLVVWLSFSVQTIILLGLRWPLNQELTGWKSAIITTVIVLFLFWTALQNLRTSANLALFTNKLAIAILMAALIRIRGGWPIAWNALAVSGSSLGAMDWRWLSYLFFYVGPLALLAADFGCRSRTRKQAALIGLFGLAFAIAVSLFVAGFIEQATHALPMRMGNGIRLAAALFSGTSSRNLPPRMMVTAITMFGSARFAIRTLSNAIPFENQNAKRITLGLLACLIAGLAAMRPESGQSMLEFGTRCLVVAAAIFTADFIAGSWRSEKPKKVAWIGVIAFSVGISAPYGLWYLFGLDIPVFLPAPLDPEWYPWLLQSYFFSFMVCLLLRMGCRLRLSGRRLHLQ